MVNSEENHQFVEYDPPASFSHERRPSYWQSGLGLPASPRLATADPRTDTVGRAEF